MHWNLLLPLRASLQIAPEVVTRLSEHAQQTKRDGDEKSLISLMKSSEKL
jgi:hypothetical protein